MKLSGALSARAQPSVAEVSGAQRPKAIVGPKNRPIRNAITSLHRWFGLAAAGWLFGIALTGSIITFNHEIDALLNPDLFVASSKGPVAPLLADAERRTGAGKINFLLYVHDAHGLVTMGITRNDGQSAELFYDSGNGRFNGERTTSSYGLGNRAFMRTAYRLHHTFLGGRALEVFLGLLALAWAITQVLALAIAFTSRIRWRDSFRVRPFAGGHKRNFDLHRSLNLWLYPVTLMLAVTGIYLNLPEQFAAAVASVAPVEGRFEPSVAGGQSAPQLTMADAALRFDGIAAPYSVTSFSFNDEADLYRARMRDARDISDNGQRIVWLSGQTGTIVSDRHETEGSAGDKILVWQFPLHSGRALGLAGRILIAFAGLVICFSIVTGLLIWFKKTQQRKRASHKTIYSQP